MSNDRQNRAARAEQMRKEREKADRKQRNLITVGIVVVVIALIAVGGYGINAASKANEKEDKVVQPANATKDFGIVYDAAAAGATPPADAKPVSVEVYEDFQCPICRSFEEQSGDFLRQQVASGAVTVTYRPFSFLDDTGGSPNDYSKRSTSAALCALDKGGVADYIKVHDYLYANQPDEGTPGPENAALAKAIDGLGISGVDSCVKTEKFVPWVKKARTTASDSDRKVDSTPTVYVGGKAVENPSPQGLQAAIDAAKAA
ncbi:DsbA family protein [Aeromicrobium endophyticum]|nr:thioredoxin domain-containing protein [Aeromicrobium endophyticum]